MSCRKTLAVAAAFGTLALCLGPATVSRARMSHPTSVCIPGNETWELSKLQENITNKNQIVMMSVPILLTITGLHSVEVYDPYRSNLWGSMAAPLWTSGEELRFSLTSNNDQWVEAYNRSLLGLRHAVESVPPPPPASKGPQSLGLAALLTKTLASPLAALGSDLLAKWEKMEAIMEKHLLPPGSPKPCEGYWIHFVIVCIIVLSATGYMAVEFYSSSKRTQKEDDLEALVDTIVGAELGRPTEGVAAVPPLWSATQAARLEEENAKKAMFASMKSLLMELSILFVMCMACLLVGSMLYTIGKYGVGSIVMVATLTRKCANELNFKAAVDISNVSNRKDKCQYKKQRALHPIFLGRTFLAPILGDYENGDFVDTFMAKRWGRVGNAELLQDEGLIGSVLGDLLSQEAEGVPARSPIYSTVFEELGETAVDGLLAKQAEGAETVAPFTLVKVIKQRWTLARILGITLSVRRQRGAPSCTPTTSSARTASQSGGVGRFRSESVLSRGAPSSSINVDGAGEVVGEAWPMDRKDDVTKNKINTFHTTLRRMFSMKSRSPASSRASAQSICVE